ncbi:MAG: tyrosine-type recombinase/integrase [Candidatus Eremiobacteraeota bacterium]|nr:tyrosine-type recombinase/integrase [Candidatus Eremiobacteraeota bacterium]
MSSAYDEADLVFCNELGGPLHQHNLSQRVFPRIVERAGLPGKLTPYSLRHSAATALLRAREGLKVVSELLGHSSITLTADVYATSLQTNSRARPARWVWPCLGKLDDGRSPGVPH